MASCYRSCLELADAYHLESIAFVVFLLVNSTFLKNLQQRLQLKQLKNI
ncbi:MAG: hypothetical protein ACLR43_09440 [Faecalibacillus faecis]